MNAISTAVILTLSEAEGEGSLYFAVDCSMSFASSHPQNFEALLLPLR